MRQAALRVLSKLFRLHLNQLALDAKSEPSVQIAQKSLFEHYRQLVREGRPLPSTDEVGYRVYSQFDEDGILLFLFAVAGFGSRRFVDIGSSDGINSNCANFAVHFGFSGVFIDGDPDALARGEKYYKHHPATSAYPPQFVQAYVTRENINDLILGAGVEGEIDLLSVDIDGNDYWVWDAVTCVSPRVVCIETHTEFGTENIVVPYDPDYVYPGQHPDYHGASPTAMVNLARKKGYRLVATNLYGFNTIYLRNDLAVDLLPEKSVDDILRHPRNAERQKRFEAIRDFPYVSG